MEIMLSSMNVQSMFGSDLRIAYYMIAIYKTGKTFEQNN